MARYTGPATRISRRLNVDLVGGDSSFERRPYPPGQHGRSRIKQSEYLLQMQEKQKAKYSYGVLEKQFRRYYEEAVARQGKTGDNLLQILESRLDNVVYRAGIARTRRQARQIAHSRRKPDAEADLVELPAERRPIVTHKELLELRKQLNTLVAAYTHQSGKPHGVIHNELRRVCGGPPIAEATAGQIKDRISKVREWATRMR